MTALEARPRRVVLIGMMGSGKTTVGRLLAARTGWPYVDNDDILRELFGVTPREALATGGEIGLRTLESEALEAALARPAPCIVAVPAGTILDARNRRRLAEARGTVVWLRGDVSTLAQRAVGSTHRAWLDEGPEEWFRAALAEREPLYLAVADLVVDVDERTPSEIVDLIVGELEVA